MNESNIEVPVAAAIKSRMLFESSNLSISSNGFRLNIDRADGHGFGLDLSRSVLERACRFWPAERLSRGGFSSFVLRDDAVAIAVARKRIVAIDLDTRKLIATCTKVYRDLWVESCIQRCK